MIKCPKCGSEHVSIVTEIKSEKKEEIIISIIQAISFITCLITIFCFIGISIKSFDALIYFIKNSNIESLINISEELIKDIQNLNLIYKITKISFFTILITTTIKLLIPYTYNSKEKCICHNCESQWNYTKKNPS